MTRIDACQWKHRRDIPDTAIIESCERWQRGEGAGPWTDFASVPPKLLLAKLDHMVDRGLLDYGVSLTYPWPTEKGMELLT